MNWYEDFLKKFFHDPIDKPLNVPEHEKRAREYAEFFGVSGIGEGKYSDQIASCMERSLLPQGVQQELTEIRHPLSEEKIGDGESEEGEKEIFSSSYSQNFISEISKSLKEISSIDF